MTWLKSTSCSKFVIFRMWMCKIEGIVHGNQSTSRAFEWNRVCGNNENIIAIDNATKMCYQFRQVLRHRFGQRFIGIAHSNVVIFFMAILNSCEKVESMQAYFFWPFWKVPIWYEQSGWIFDCRPFGIRRIWLRIFYRCKFIVAWHWRALVFGFSGQRDSKLCTHNQW